MIKSQQVLACVLQRGVQNIDFNFEFSNRNNKQMIIDLGETIVEICTKVKGGILIFFPSYLLLKDYKEIWAATGIRKKIKEKT